MKALDILYSYDLSSDSFKSRVSFDNFINNRLVSKKIRKIRKGLYALVDPSTGGLYANKYQIASNVSKTSYVSYHSALEYYGFFNQVFSNMIVSSITRFNSFEFENINYEYKLAKDTFMVEEKNSLIRVTSLEKTVIDCINKIDLAGGIAELLNALSMMPPLKEGDLLLALEHYKNNFLYCKAGYLLSLFNNLHLSKNFFKICKSKVTSVKYYFLDDEYDEMMLDKKWNLIVPKNVMGKIKGGFNINEFY